METFWNENANNINIGTRRTEVFVLLVLVLVVKTRCVSVSPPSCFTVSRRHGTENRQLSILRMPTCHYQLRPWDLKISSRTKSRIDVKGPSIEGYLTSIERGWAKYSDLLVSGWSTQANHDIVWSPSLIFALSFDHYVRLAYLNHWVTAHGNDLHFKIFHLRAIYYLQQTHLNGTTHE